jgi:hypothetical protein
MSSELPRRVLVLLHARDRGALRRPYQVWGLAEIWRSWGVRVDVQRGVGRFEEADVAINHVDLTVVPEEYVAHLARYPVAVNGRATDISKRRVSANLLRRDEAWDGPVIVKTDRNCGGERERELLRGPAGRLLDDLRALGARGRWRSRRTLATDDYPVLGSVADVPDGAWENPALVVERFLPEREGDLYVLHNYVFFGDRAIGRRLLAPHPVVKAGRVVHREEEAPHPDAVAFARRFGLDRGKVDYVVRGGRAVVLDVARTNTLAPSMTPQRRRETCERLAPGLRGLARSR